LVVTVIVVVTFVRLSYALIWSSSVKGVTQVWFDLTDTLQAAFSLSYTAVPEPSTYLAGLGALGMLGIFGWKNRK